MPIIVLNIKAELENIKEIRIRPEHRFCFTVKESAGEETKDRVFVSAAEEVELSGSKGKANLALKFYKGSKKEAHMVVMPLKGVTRSYTANDERKFVPLMGFECRGLEPTVFFPEDGWVIETNGGTVFEDVDLSEGEWCDYCEKGKEPVGISGFESTFTVSKGGK